MKINKERNANQGDNETFEEKEKRWEDNEKSLEMMSDTVNGNYEDGKGTNKNKNVTAVRTQQIEETGSVVFSVRTVNVDIDNFSVTVSSVDDDEDEKPLTMDWIQITKQNKTALHILLILPIYHLIGQFNTYYVEKEY